jgi:hypothetical protein
MPRAEPAALADRKDVTAALEAEVPQDLAAVEEEATLAAAAAARFSPGLQPAAAAAAPSTQAPIQTTVRAPTSVMAK